MTTLDKAIELFGFENPITITIAVLAEQGKHEMAEQLFEECSKDIYGDPQDAGADDLDSTVHFMDDVDECGFDPYMGCYTGDC
jgi:hypothetical protein